jgi:post-segregation antitoxin (ccd killing protein)
VKMTVYLPDDLAAAIRELEDANISSICQGALRAELDRKRTGEETQGGKKTIADYVAQPFTENIDDYLVWLERQTGPFAEIAPRRLAGLAITLYRFYQRSDERRAARGLGPAD